MTSALPFTAAQFFEVFADYNEKVWPAPVIAYALGAFAFAAALCGARAGNRIVVFVLAVFWLWTGIAYHWFSFAAINRAAWAFGTLFVAQGVLLFWFGIMKARLNFRFRSGLTGAVAILFVAYAALIYPAVGYAAGHVYPRMPMFGITPCPVTIFTLGMLLLAQPVPWAVLIIPVLWSLIGGSAAFLLGVPQDWLLLVSGPVALFLRWRDAPLADAPRAKAG